MRKAQPVNQAKLTVRDRDISRNRSNSLTILGGTSINGTGNYPLFKWDLLETSVFYALITAQKSWDYKNLRIFLHKVK